MTNSKSICFSILYFQSHQATFSGPCLMDLTRFPFDNVTCALTFESFKLVAPFFVLIISYYLNSLLRWNPLILQFPFSNRKYCSNCSYNTDEVQMSWSPLGVSKMREKMELADYELTSIEQLRVTAVGYNLLKRINWYLLVRRFSPIKRLLKNCSN